MRPLTLAEIEERLRGFEDRFGMPTAKFAQAFRDGMVEEDDDFREWAMLAAAHRVASRTS